MQLACPACGALATWLSADGRAPRNCSGCGFSVTLVDNRLEWGAPAAPAPVASSSGPGPLGVIRRWVNRRTEDYYERTLSDRTLSDAWRAHYLAGLDLPAQATVFEHGGGRGRHVGLLAQAGYRVTATDVAVHPWWGRLPNSCFHVVPVTCRRLPWADAQFDLALSFLVISFVPEDELAGLLAEMRRVLKPGGYLLIFESSTEGFGAPVAQRWYGRLHSLATVRAAAARQGLTETDVSLEGFASPVLPATVNFIRKSLAPRGIRMTDYDSWLARLTPERRRDRWLLRLRRPS